MSTSGMKQDLNILSELSSSHQITKSTYFWHSFICKTMFHSLSDLSAYGGFITKFQ